MGDPDATAAALAETVRYLQEHIERRASELAEAQTRAAQEAAAAHIDELRRDVAAWEQRFKDLQGENERQADELERGAREREESRETREELRKWVSAVKGVMEAPNRVDCNGTLVMNVADILAAVYGALGWQRRS